MQTITTIDKAIDFVAIIASAGERVSKKDSTAKSFRLNFKAACDTAKSKLGHDLTAEDLRQLRLAEKAYVSALFQQAQSEKFRGMRQKRGLNFDDGTVEDVRNIRTSAVVTWHEAILFARMKEAAAMAAVKKAQEAYTEAADGIDKTAAAEELADAQSAQRKVRNLRIGLELDAQAAADAIAESLKA